LACLGVAAILVVVSYTGDEGADRPGCWPFEEGRGWWDWYHIAGVSDSGITEHLRCVLCFMFYRSALPKASTMCV
jgi:hypothetical protein